MGFALVLRELLSRWRLLVIGILLAAVAATLSVYRLDGFKLKARSLQHSSASTQVLVDSPASSLGDLKGTFEGLNVRASVYANFMTTPAVLDLIGKQMGISGRQIYAAGPLDSNLSKIIQEPTDLKRNIQITGETDPYRLSYTSDPNLPTVGINSQAPTTSQAIVLANSAAFAIQEYVAALQKTAKVPAAQRVTIRQLGTANGAVDNAGISKSLAGIVLVAVFLLWCVLVLLGARFRNSWRASAEIYNTHDEVGADARVDMSLDDDRPQGAVRAADIPAPPNGHSAASDSPTPEVSVPAGATRSRW
jgi:hypothetical protein